MLKKNLSIILVIVLTLLLIVMVIWVFDKRIDDIEKEKRSTSGYFNTKGSDPFIKKVLIHFLNNKSVL